MAVPIRTRPLSLMRHFLATEAAGGSLLIASAIMAMLAANTSFAATYTALLQANVGGLSVIHWINDGLMAVFFLLVGLEIKREVLAGQLSRWSDRLLPGAAALAGVAVPAMIYAGLNRDDGPSLRGWAIPAATDIAFALGVLALLGNRVPPSLRIFIAAVAIIDDLIAVLIIAIFYTADIDLSALGGAVLGLLVLVTVNRGGGTALWPYLLIGGLIWWCVLKSGLHPTLAGVAVAMTVPLKPSRQATDASRAPLLRLEHRLHPWVAFGIVPLFGFANAGVTLAGMTLADLHAPVPMGIELGLLLGKQAGIFGAMALMVWSGMAKRPLAAQWVQIYGMALLCGIGFTMSLFIGGLTFGDGTHQDDAAKLGVLMGSILSALAGFVVLRLSAPPQKG